MYEGRKARAQAMSIRLLREPESCVVNRSNSFVRQSSCALGQMNSASQSSQIAKTCAIQRCVRIPNRRWRRCRFAYDERDHVWIIQGQPCCNPSRRIQCLGNPITRSGRLLRMRWDKKPRSHRRTIMTRLPPIPLCYTGSNAFTTVCS